MYIRLSIFAVLTLLVSTFASAQMSNRFNFSAGGGFTVPTERFSNSVNTGWNVNFRGGVNINPEFLADLDFTYVNSRFNDATLAQFGEPDGGIGIWSLTFNPVVRLAPSSSPIRPYVTGGYGLYHLNFTLSRPTTVPTVFCGGFFGFCFPTTVGVDQTVASNSTYKGGFNAGAGFDISLGQHRAKLFTEARYHRMFTTHSGDISYIPVTFGLRW